MSYPESNGLIPLATFMSFALAAIGAVCFVSPKTVQSLVSTIHWNLYPYRGLVCGICSPKENVGDGVYLTGRLVEAWWTMANIDGGYRCDPIFPETGRPNDAALAALLRLLRHP
jgi:hypothetical protein